MDLNPQSKKKGDVVGRLLQKMLMPIVAATASAAATYAAKKAPQVLEERVVPKLRNALTSAGDAAQDLPAKAKSAADGAGDVAERLTERAKSVAGAGVKTSSATDGRRAKRLSSDELERRLESRERARA